MCRNGVRENTHQEMTRGSSELLRRDRAYLVEFLTLINIP